MFAAAELVWTWVTQASESLVKDLVVQLFGPEKAPEGRLRLPHYVYGYA